METRQIILEISSNFLSALQDALLNPDSASSPSLDSPIPSLIDSTPGLSKHQFVHDSLHTSYHKIRQQLTSATNDTIALAISLALKKLHFTSNRLINLKTLNFRVNEAKNKIDEEIALLHYIEKIEPFIDSENAKLTALQLSLIGSELINELAKQNIQDTDNIIYKRAGVLSRALSYLVKNQLEDDIDFNSKLKILINWINILDEENKIKDTHSIAAILPIIIEYEASLRSSQDIFLSLPKPLKKTYHELRKKYDPEKNNPDQMFDDYRTATIPHLGNIQQLAINHTQSIMPEKLREKALLSLKQEILSAKDRAAKHTKKVRRKTMPNNFELAQIQVRSLSQTSELNSFSSSEQPITARSLEAASSSVFFGAGMQRSKSEQSTPQASPHPSKKKR